jgi:hypothetical protein
VECFSCRSNHAIPNYGRYGDMIPEPWLDIDAQTAAMLGMRYAQHPCRTINRDLKFAASTVRQATRDRHNYNGLQTNLGPSAMGKGDDKPEKNTAFEWAVC